jgi:hypothetical protein
MKLKHKKEVKITVSCWDLDKFITEYFAFPRKEEMMDKYNDKKPKDGIYLREFEFVAIEEANNDSCYTFDITGDLYDWDKPEMEEMLATKKFDNYSTRRILDYLCSEGVIDKGNYLIDVSW